ncbi:MAG: hypothetical protein JNJ54_33115 [Myxococcaceae bacterium]|nr:hypothetical protein [Myxococcaceae bacterium]
MTLRLALVLAACALPSCKKDPLEPSAPAIARPAGATPTEVPLTGAYHAVKCGAVTASWTGSAADLEGLAAEGRPAPKTYGVTGLSFLLADGSRREFTPSGELAFSDWSFDIFSPDCSRVALLQDRSGPFTVLATKDLATFSNPKAFKAPGEPASVHGQWRWTGPSSFEFVASCCGGARVLSGDAAADAPLTQVFEAASAPSGLLRGAKGWEVAK